MVPKSSFGWDGAAGFVVVVEVEDGLVADADAAVESAGVVVDFFDFLTFLAEEGIRAGSGCGCGEADDPEDDEDDVDVDGASGMDVSWSSFSSDAFDFLLFFTTSSSGDTSFAFRNSVFLLF
jgi:hypothetical protein